MPVYKVNSNAVNSQPRAFKPPWVKEETPSTPSAPPWRRQQELRGPKTPSSPGTKTEAPVFPKPAEAVEDAKPPAPVRKQSKITIIPSKPVQNGSSSMLAAPPPLPAPPPNPDLARAPSKSSMEPSTAKINLQRKLSDASKRSNQAQNETPKAKVVPIKIERSPSPPAAAKSKQPVKAKSPSPPPKAKQNSTAKPALTKSESISKDRRSPPTVLRIPSPAHRPWLEKTPSPSFWSDTSSPPESPIIKSPHRVTPTPPSSPEKKEKSPSPDLRSSSPDIWSRSSTPPNRWGKRQLDNEMIFIPIKPAENEISYSPSTAVEATENHNNFSSLKPIDQARSPTPDIWSRSSTPPPRIWIRSLSMQQEKSPSPVTVPAEVARSPTPDIWADRPSTPPPSFKMTVKDPSPVPLIHDNSLLDTGRPQEISAPNQKQRKVKRNKDEKAPKKQTRKASSPPSKQLSPPPADKKSGPVPPPPPPMAPPPPPPPPPGFKENKKPISEEKRARIDALKNRPRRRPDWAYMMKEVESGVKLRHVETNDRSKPLLPKVKAKGQFIYESESGANVHHKLLSQIQKGVLLKQVKCNDRSKPILEGLRKFRRQLTIEEQLTPSGKPKEPLSDDDLDDIDKVRDDLQSTKQMLEFELKEKERLQKENRKLGARILNLEEEVDKLRKIVESSGQENTLVVALRAELETAKKETAKQEAQCQETNKQLAAAKAQLEDSQHRNLVLERRLESGGGGRGVPPETSSSGTQTVDLQKVSSRRDASIPETLQPEPDSDEEEETETEEESEEESSESDEGEAQAAQERRVQRELKMLVSKVKSVKDKEVTAKNERTALKYQQANLARALRAEQRKFRLLQREVDKMANIMKEEEDDEGGEEAPEEEIQSEEEETEESESESEEESDQDDPADPPAMRIEALTKQSKTHENSLSALKKGNYMLKVNIDKLKDDLEKQREKSLALQEDLNAVLAEIG